MSLHHALHDGSLWLVIVCLATLAGVVIGSYTDRGSGIARHPYTKPDLGGELAADLPAEAIGRAELEPRLWRRAPRRRPADVPRSR